MADFEPGAAFVRQPDEGESFWQPVPANGYAEVRVSKRDSPKIQGFSSGIQVIAPGCLIREHQHGAEQELLFFFEGTGKILINGVERPVHPGTTAYLGPWNKHKIINEGAEDLKPQKWAPRAMVSTAVGMVALVVASFGLFIWGALSIVDALDP